MFAVHFLSNWTATSTQSHTLAHQTSVGGGGGGSVYDKLGLGAGLVELLS